MMTEFSNAAAPKRRVNSFTGHFAWEVRCENNGWEPSVMLMPVA